MGFGQILAGGTVVGMKIRRLESDSELVRRRNADLRELLSQPSEADQRVCSECTLSCPSCESTACTCSCSMDCPHIPTQMTSDPRFPIETAIVPLVYALSSLRLCEPCWSCEGHANASGTVTRIPRVWFYCRSLTYPRLMDRYFSHLKLKRRLNYPWHLCVTHSDTDNADTAFSIEPDLTYVERPTLALLQRDIRPIADGLAAYIRTEARARLGAGPHRV